MDTEAIDKLFLELAQFTKALTKTEMRLARGVVTLRDILEKNGIDLKEALADYGESYMQGIIEQAEEISAR